MSELNKMVSALDAELKERFEARLREELEGRDASWLSNQLVELILQNRHLESAPQRQLSRQEQHVEPLPERRQRLERIRQLGLNEASVKEMIKLCQSLTREELETEQYLIAPPHKGKEALGTQNRSTSGESLLRRARDFFYALLFCDERQGVHLTRSRRDFLTVTLPSAKAESLERFLLAVTETQVAGTWLDPEGVSDDVEAPNTILQVEFGDTADELVCDGLIAVLGLINNLEVNEEILYARIEKIDRSTLIQ